MSQNPVPQPPVRLPPLPPAAPLPPGLPLPPGTQLPPGAPPLPDDAFDEEADDEFEDEFDEAPAAQLSLRARLRRLPPFAVLLSAASVVSLAFLALTLSSRSVAIPVVAASLVVTGIVFAADTVVLGVGTYRAGEDGSSGRALLLALAGGMSALIAGVSFGGALVMVLLGL